MKNFLLFNQSFGTEGSPNQTGETQTRENLIGLMSYLRRTLMLLFAVLVMSIANIGMAWGDTFTDTHTVPTANTGLFSKIVTGDGASFGNSSLQTTSNGGTGSFTISTTDGSYISGITFTAKADDRKPETFTSSDGTISNTGTVYTFTPSTATKTSCTFTMKGASTKTVRFAPVAVSLTSEYEYFSMNFSISSGTVSCTKSNGSSDVTITSTGSVTSNMLQVNSGKNLVLTSSAHNIQAIHFSFENHADKTYTASTGTYSSNTWTSNSNTQTVTFSSSASTNIVGFSVELASVCNVAPTAPTGLAAGTLTRNGATFTITDGANTNNYEIVCKTTSGTPASNATPTATGTSKTIVVSSLSPSTTYYAWVRSVCDETYKSSWVALGSGTFTTEDCPASGEIFSLTVKSASYSVPGNTETNMVSDYATVSGGGAYIGNNNGSSGKAQVATTGSGTVFFNGQDGYVKLVLDCPIQTGDQLTFVNGSGSNQICFSTTNSQNTSNTTVSNTYTFPAAFNGASTIYVWRTSGSSTYMHSLTITRPAACSAPTSPTNGASTSSSRVVSWTAPGSAPAGGYLVAYSSATSTAPGDAVQAAGTNGDYTVIAVAAGTTTATLSALSAGTTYNWWVRSKCGDSSFSSWVAGTSFTTDAEAPAAITRRMFLNLGGVWGTDASYKIHAWGDGSSVDYPMTRIGETGFYYADIPISKNMIQYVRNNYDNQSYDLNWHEAGENQCAKITAWHGGDGNVANPSSTAWEIYHDGRQTFALDNYVYYDNSVTQWSNVYFRIGKWNVSQAYEMTKEPGTKDLYSYQRTGTAWEGYEVFNFADNWANANGNVYYPDNDKSTWSGEETNFARESLSSNRYYRGESPYVTSSYAHYHNLTELSAYTVTATGTNCTVTLEKCTDYSAGTYTTLTSGGTVLPTQYIKVTVTPNTGYEFSEIEVTGVGTITEAADGTPGVYYVTDNATISATCTAKTINITLAKGDHGAANKSATVKYDATALTSITHVTPNTGYTRTGYYDGSTKVLEDDGTFAAATVSGYITSSKWTKATDCTLTAKWSATSYTLSYTLNGGSVASDNPTSYTIESSAITLNNPTKTGYTFAGWTGTGLAEATTTVTIAAGSTGNRSYTATWTAKQTTITINANTANHGSTAPSPITATYGSALPSFTPAAGVSGWNLTGYFTEATSGTKVINADGTLVPSTDYADGTGKWKSEAATLTLFAQYEEEVVVCQDTIYNFTKEIGETAVAGDNAKASITSSTNFKLSGGNGRIKIIPSSGKFKNGDVIYLAGTVNDYSKEFGAVVYASNNSAEIGTFSITGTSGTLTVSGSLILASDQDSLFLKRAGSTTTTYTTCIVSRAADCSEPCSTPSAPTATSNGATAATTQVVSWTDGSNDKWDVYVSTSNSTPAAGVTPTASGLTAKTYTFTGLTASTTYYWWVRSVCDDTHKSSWFAGSSFETSAAVVSQTALEDGTLYEVPDMIPSGKSLTSDDQFFDGLSANTKFELIGSGSSSETPKVNNSSSNDKTIAGITFDDGSMWFRGEASLTSNIPTTYGLSFIVPTTGKLTLYFGTDNTTIKLAKSGSAGSAPTLTDGCAVVDVTEGTYYLYGTATSGNYRFYGLKLVTCTTPAAPTALTCSAHTSSSLTFGWTGAEHASGYTASLYNNSGCTGDPVASQNLGDVNSVTFTSLSASTTYWCKIQSKGDGSTYCAEGGTTAAQSGATDAADATAPTFVSSDPANGATGVATSGTIVLTFSEPIASVDATKFTLDGATMGAVAIDGTDATKVNVAYSGASNEAAVTLSVAAAAVNDAAGNALAAELSNISFTTAASGEAPIPALISYYLQTPNSKTKPVSLSTDSIITTPKRLKGDTLKNFVPVTLGSSLGITKAGKGDGGTWSAGIGTTPADSATAVTDAYAAKLAFNIHDDYELNISSITLNVKSVTNASQIYRVKVSDGENTVYGRVAPAQDKDNSVVFGSFSGIKFSGTVTLTLWVWSNAAAEYRLKSPIQIDGTLTRKATACTMPTQTFSAGAYTLGDAALNLSTLFSSNSSGAVTYSVVNAGGTSATIVGSSFTASSTGTATIRATQAADGVNNKCAKSIETTITVSGTCTPQSLSKVYATKGTSGTVTGYNDGQYAGDAVVNLYSKSPQPASLPGVDSSVDGYKMGDAGTSIVFATLKGTSFQVGDKVRIGITRRNDLRQVDSKHNILTIYYGTNKSDADSLTTITTGGDNDNGAEGSEGAGFYEYTLTDGDVTTIGSKKGIGLFRESTNGENPFVYSVEIIGCREWAVCTAPNAVVASGATHNSAVLTVTDAEETDNYEFYYSTSSTAPTASTVALATSSALTKTITGLTANTTYYYWVRSNCGGVTKSAWVAGTPATFTTTAAPSTYSVTYDGNGKSSGDVPTDATAYAAGDIVTVKGNTGNLEKTSQTFLGWSTSATASSGTFYPAGYKFEMPASNVKLYAVWGSVGATCVTLTHFESSNHSKSNNKPDSRGYYFYGYKGSVSTDKAVTITTGSSNNKGFNSATDYMRFYYGSSVYIYADNTTTSGTPASFEGITSISLKIKLKKTAPTLTIKVGSTTIADAVSLSSANTSSFTTYTYENLEGLDGVIQITNNGSGDSNYEIYLDDIQICYGSGASSGYTVSFNMNGHGSAIADIENIPSGSKIGAPLPEPTAADYDFGGWYKDDELSNDWDFATDAVSANTTLYAKWGNCAPTITTHPVAANYNQNGVASALTVVAATNGGGDLHYQWWVKENDLAEEDGSAIPGETGNSFTPSTELLGTSYYYCVVSNDCGNVKTNTAAVTIRDAKPAPTAVWDVEEPTHGGKGFSFSVEVNKDDDDNWDGTLEASMLTLSSEAVLDESSIVVDHTNKTISGTYGVKGSATSPVTFYLLLPATATQAAARLDHDQSFTPCEGSDGTPYYIRVRKTAAHVDNKYYWDNPDGWISSNTTSSIGSGKSGTVITVMDTDFDTIGSSNTQNVWVRTYHANIKKVRIYAQFRADNMTVNNVYKHSDFLSADSKYIVAYSAVYNGDAEATGLGDADSFGYVDITLEEPMSANDVLLVKFSTDRVRPLGAVLTEGRSGGSGSLETSLVWSNNQANGANLVKREDDVDFAVTANRNDANALASLGTISYSSSNTSVATVNAATGQVTIADNIDFGSADYKTTTITATLAASGCYKRCVLTYVLQVNKYVCTEAVGTVRIKTDNGCSGKVLEVSGYEEGATIQWYKDGNAISDEKGTTYTATTAGAYYVVTHKDCDAVSNEITINFGAATATKIVDSWYIKNGRRTPDIALVQTTNATGFTVTTGSPASDITSTGIGGCTFELKEDGIIYLHGTTSTGAAPSGMTPGDMTITITATACSNAAPLDIVLHIQSETAKPSIAFVVDGTLRKDGGTATSVLEAKTSERPIWKYLENTFALTGCNAYWSVDSKELRQYYSQFDAILITDDPNTSTSGTGGVSYVKAFGTMVDVRPVLTMEAYVGKFKDGGWHVYDATPSSPNPRQVELKLECKNHDIFKGLNPATSDNVRTTTDENGNEYWHVIMVDTTQSPYHNTKSDYEALPALQGFDKTKFDHMLGVGTIFGEKLQAGVERQEEPAARMMILGIQNNAMAALTTEGKLVVKNALDYLLKTNMEDVNDCSNYFTDADGDGQWSNGANWTRGEVPDFETRARILTPVTIGDGTTAIAARVDIAAGGESKHLGQRCNGSITIEPQGILKVGGKVTRAKAPYFGIDDLQPTENSDLIVKASTTAPHNQGALIFDNSDGDTHAVVEMWNPSYWEVVGGKKKKYWSYVAVPIQEADIPNFFWYGFTYLYDETSGWIKKSDGTSLYPFQGIGASLQTGHMETFYGPLATTESQDITLTYTSDKGQGMNLIGNSWTAPIQIANFEEDDFGDAAAEVWVFNTGNKNEGHSTMEDGSAGTTTAGQWQTIPIGVAGLPGYTGLKVIPAMQAFEVNTESETTLHLDYDRLVRAGRENLNEPMRSPRRSAAKQIEATMRVRVSGELTHTDVYLLKDARFSDGFDNGWDGHFLSGDDRSAQLYAISEEEGKLAFLAQPEIEGTQLGFAPSKHGNEYTFSFSYDGDEEYYLNDLKLKKSTPVQEDETYQFMYEEGDANRFYISKTAIDAPQVPTGVTDLDDEAPKARKVIYNDKMYIFNNGRVYDAQGKVVK